MSESEAARLAHQAASRAHVAKNALRADVGLTNLAAAVERLSQAVGLLASSQQQPRQEPTEGSTSPDEDEVLAG